MPSDMLQPRFESTIWLIVLPLLLAAMIVGIVFLVRSTIRKRGRLGINFNRVCCPECGMPAPAVRMPQNMREALWGGHTCANCGLEFDKWGRPVHERDRRRLNEERGQKQAGFPAAPDEGIKRL